MRRFNRVRSATAMEVGSSRRTSATKRRCGCRSTASAAGRSVDEASAQGDGYRRGAARNVELAVDAAQMGLYGRLAEP